MRKISNLPRNLAPVNEIDFGILIANTSAPSHIDSRFQPRPECDQSNVKLPKGSSKKDLDPCALQGRDIGSNTETKESFMKNIVKVGLVLSMILVFGAGSVLAADQKRDRKRDRTCRSYTTTESSVFDLAADKQRDRKRDRSCRSFAPAKDDSLTLAADRTRTRTPKRDSSC
jgi:hypothetical protein